MRHERITRMVAGDPALEVRVLGIDNRIAPAPLHRTPSSGAGRKKVPGLWTALAVGSLLWSIAACSRSVGTGDVPGESSVDAAIDGDGSNPPPPSAYAGIYDGWESTDILDQPEQPVLAGIDQRQLYNIAVDGGYLLLSWILPGDSGTVYPDGAVTLRDWEASNAA